MFEYSDIEQNTDDWFLLRSGLPTSSKLGTIMANDGKAFSDTAKKYAVNIAVEQILGRPRNDIGSYSNDHMKRGHEQEPIARAMYEDEFFCTVDNGGFFTNGKVGCSPDGLVDSDGAIEIKSVIATTHYANIKRRSFDPAYKWQCIGNLLFTGREWLDFVSYSAEFPEDMQLYTFRLWKDQYKEEFERIKDRLQKFYTLIEDTKKTVLNADYAIIKKEA